MDDTEDKRKNSVQASTSLNTQESEIQNKSIKQDQSQQGNTQFKGTPFKRYDPITMPTPEQILQDDISGSCVVKSVISLVGGGLMGAVFGLVFGSFEMAHPLEPQPQNQKFMEALRQTLTMYRLKCWSYSKTFGTIGFLFAGSECLIEYYRARHDWQNSMGAGCFTGAALGYKSGIQGMGFGCVSFAAFSVIIDRYLQHD